MWWRIAMGCQWQHGESMKKKRTFNRCEIFILGICMITLLMACIWFINRRIEARNNQNLMRKLASTMNDTNHTLLAPIPLIKITPVKEKRVTEIVDGIGFIKANDLIGGNDLEKDDEIIEVNDLDEINDLVGEHDLLEASKAVESNTKPQMLPKFTELYQHNSDILAWLSIDETTINYPVMYTPMDGEYYLHRNFNKDEEKRGLPFLDANTNIYLSQNYLVYGHNMKDGTGFHDLLNYTEEDYYLEHPIIHFDTLYEEADYEIIAVFKTQIFYEKEEVFKYYKYINILDETSYKEYIKNIKEQSLYETGVTASIGDKLLTLSTCSYHIPDGRFVIVAKKKEVE